jgi:hypothetical protein
MPLGFRVLRVVLGATLGAIVSKEAGVAESPPKSGLNFAAIMFLPLSV